MYLTTRHRKLTALLACAALVCVAAGKLNASSGGRISTSSDEVGAARGADDAARATVRVRYTVDAGRSKFIVRAFAGGALWFKGHDHFVAAKDFEGEAELTPDSVSPASLQMRVRAASLEETRDVFTPQQKQIINKELREIVLEPDKYPEITFKSKDVSGKLEAGVYKVRIGGDLTLHGVTRRVVIPAQVTLDGRGLRARGEFEIERGDFNIKATSAFHGTVRVRDKLKVIFDILAHQI
ncbi:MAG: YceI family protein [Acidobacteria bacterium]|nr:YceI family protein [Acidobacteriota bacterium]